jgi:hypothetical protein
LTVKKTQRPNKGSLCGDPTCDCEASAKFFVTLTFKLNNGENMRAYFCGTAHRERIRRWLCKRGGVVASECE